ncbi:putative monodehydroascorbate reductase (NADH) [Rosa chinensis]|uniref:Putative monodehydroascorbate reductase (NADH) n=1 Tax=Rosa chinensis TaxID=74649 RepID=A0A2P6RB19_ROSCH|nr:thioredoxin-like 3-3 [Rosa chinensis]PRQ43623.1 putative monodehydroascorbate reductase (NADH) [Rosa chinensis]
MEGGTGSTGDDANTNNGLDGTTFNLPANRHGNLKTASSDQSLSDILLQIKSSKTPAVINYGATWCRVCSQILPAFCKLSNSFPKLSFVYADIDECPETTQHIRYTPTFHFYRDGERVDEMFGAGEERLHDRLWLHS